MVCPTTTSNPGVIMRKPARRTAVALTTALLTGAAVLMAPAPALAVNETANPLYLKYAAGRYSTTGAVTPGPAIESKYGEPTDLAFDAAGNMYVSDATNCQILKVDANGTLSVVAGTDCTSSGTPPTSGPATQAHLGQLTGVAYHNGTIYAASSTLSSIYAVDAVTGALSVLAGDGTAGALVDGAAASSRLRTPGQLSVTGGVLYFGDVGNHQVAKVDLSSGQLTIVAGNGMPGTPSLVLPAMPATGLPLNTPYGVAARGNGDVYVADSTDSKVYKVSAGMMSVVDSLLPSVALAFSPVSGELYSINSHGWTDHFNLAENAAHNPGWWTSAGAGNDLTTAVSEGPGLSSVLNQPWGLDFDPNGNLYAAVRGDHKVVRLAWNNTARPGQPLAAPSVAAGPGAITVTTTGTATGYTVYTYADGTYQPDKTCVSATTTCTVSGLSPAVNYTFRYTRKNDAGTSFPSPYTAAISPTAATPVDVPSPPLNVTAVAGLRKATVSWEAPDTENGSDITGYLVETFLGTEELPYTCTTAGTLSCDVEELDDGTAYTFRVTATNGAGDSEQSDASAEVTTFAKPGAPAVTEAVPGAGRVTVKWTAPGSDGGTAVTGYRVQARQGGQDVAGFFCTYTPSAVVRPDFVAVTPVVTPMQCEIGGLTDGTAYTFVVRATNAVGDGPWSAESATAVPVQPVPPVPPAPSAPGAPVAAAGVSSISVSWPAASGSVSGYVAYANPGPASCSTTASERGCVMGGTAGTSYTVTVVALGPGGSSSSSPASNAVVPVAPATQPQVPADVPATLTTDKGRLSLATPSQQITVIGTGFAPYSTAKVTIYSEPIVLATVTTDGSGSFSAPVTVPASLAAGQHTFLAQGVDALGTTRQMALPVTVPPTSPDSSGTGDETQSTKLPVPSGGGITLLDAAGSPAGTVTVAGQGTYAVDVTTGTITFVPVAGFTGRAKPVAYRITDAVGTQVTGEYTAVVTEFATGTPPTKPATGTIRLALPRRVVTTGAASRATMPASVTFSTAVKGRTTVEVSSLVSGKRVVLGSGVVTASMATTRVAVTVTLNALGRALAATPGGRPVSVTATTVTSAGTTLRALAGTTLVLSSFPVPRMIYFGSGSFVIGDVQGRFLTALRGRLAGVRTITCTGYTDDRGSDAAALTLGRARARQVCSLLARGLGARTVILSRGKGNPVSSNRTAAGQARNRRTVITLGY
jgi:CshA-type fibril repeat protein